MAIRDPERGQRRPWRYRNGMGEFPGWRGIRRQGDQASIPPNQFWYAQNCRLRGGNVISRYGQSKVNTVGIGQVDALIDGDDTELALLYAGRAAAGNNIGYYNVQQSPNEQDGILGSTPLNSVFCSAVTNSTEPRRAFHSFGGRTLVTTTDVLSSVPIVAVLNRLYQDGKVSAELERLFFAPTLTFASSVVFQGKLWFGSVDGGNVYYWDGTSLVTDVTGLGTGRTILTVYRDTLIAFGGKITDVDQFVKIRSNTGTWSTIPMPADSIRFGPQSWVVYNNILYVGGLGKAVSTDDFARILSYDGTTLSIARSLSTGEVGSAGEEDGVTDLVVFNGFLYYCWNFHSELSRCRIGQYDGTTWSDDHKIFTPETSFITAMTDYRGSLWVSFGGATSKTLWQSPGTATSGTWTQRTTTAGRGTSDIYVA